VALMNAFGVLVSSPQWALVVGKVARLYMGLWHELVAIACCPYLIYLSVELVFPRIFWTPCVQRIFEERRRR
jgi:uncharacterized membrane protein